MALQVFVSYARRDDIAPPGGGEGFVTMFLRQLEWDLNQRKPTPVLWRDKDGKVRPSDQFDDIIEKGINESGVFLVILSDNWLDRPYCQKELDWFARRWGSDAKRHIIVAAKHDLKPEDRPALLQGQAAYKFYDEEAAGKPEFFMRGKLYERELLLVIENIAGDVRERALAEDPTIRREAPAPSAARGRRVYVAKPASDMKLAYVRIVDEVQKRGHGVTPDPSAEIPLESTSAATAFVDSALEDAEVSIHLLGEKPGLATDDEQPTPLVKLQLARAAARAASTARPDAASAAFRRIIWAPKEMPDARELPSGTQRDPMGVLERFGERLSGDQIDSDELSKFTDYVLQHIADRVTRQSSPIEDLDSNSSVYIYHRREDEDYALAVADALKRRRIQPSFPIFDDTDAEVTAWHRKQLAECDAVVVCWGDAGEVWVRQQTPEWRHWQKLGREKEFACRGVIAGPPGDRKHSYMKKYHMNLLPPGEVDIVLDLTAYEAPPPEALDPLVRAASTTQNGQG